MHIYNEGCKKKQLDITNKLVTIGYYLWMRISLIYGAVRIYAYKNRKYTTTQNS